MQRRLDGFTLHELVGFGATGEVWRARPQAGGADVALKWLAADAIDVDKLEACGLRDLRHPHLARLLDIRRDGSSVVLVHEFITGVSLAVLLAERHRLSGSEVVTLLTPIAEALAAAHDAGLLHADLTPSSVLVTPDGRPIVTDLGVWQSLRRESLMATAPPRLDYRDPCVARGGSPTTASDVFGAAAIGYHALTGRAPWSAGPGADTGENWDTSETGQGRETWETWETWEKAVGGSGVDLGPLHGAAGSALSEVIARGLSDRPESRGTARDFATDVRDAGEPEPLHLGGPYLWPDLPPTQASQPAEDGREPARVGRGTRGLDIAGAVRRGGSARHAAGAGARRERVPQAGRLGLDAAPSMFGSVPRRVPARAVFSACVALAVLGMIVLGLGFDTPPPVPAEAGSPTSAVSITTGEGVPRTESGAGGIDERAIPDSAQAWAALLTVLYERRALAFGTGAVALLEQVFTDDSAQLVSDRTELTRLVQAGEVLRGFAPQVVEVLEASVDGDHAMLRITDAFAAYETVPALDTRAAAVAEAAGRGPTPVAMTLVLTEPGWRIQSAQLLE